MRRSLRPVLRIRRRRILRRHRRRRLRLRLRLQPRLNLVHHPQIVHEFRALRKSQMRLPVRRPQHRRRAQVRVLPARRRKSRRVHQNQNRRRHRHQSQRESRLQYRRTPGQHILPSRRLFLRPNRRVDDPRHQHRRSRQRLQLLHLRHQPAHVRHQLRAFRARRRMRLERRRLFAAQRSIQIIAKPVFR